MNKIKKILCFDIDNTLCTTKKSNYYQSKPLIKNIEFVNKLKKKGHYIKIFTSRFMGRNNNNAFLAKKDGYIFTKKQLKNWNLRYDELIFGKPSYDVFIDDKNLFHKSRWRKELIKKIKKI
jgi:hypothetical protein